jgi:hypothetical protein
LGFPSIDIAIGIGIDDFGLEIDQINQFTTQRHREFPLLHGNLVLGDIRLLGNLVMVLVVLAGRFQHPSATSTASSRHHLKYSPKISRLPTEEK